MHLKNGSLRSIYAGIFLISLSTLVYEIVLTRIFSVTVWYHFAFLAISLAMLGMTGGALLVHLLPQWFKDDTTAEQLSVTAFLFALSLPLALLTHASIPIVIKSSYVCSAVGIFSILANCFMLAIPFVFSGICICLVLTRFVGRVSQLYAADLLGAATACLVVVHELNQTDGPTTILLAATLSALGAVCFALSKRDSWYMKCAIVSLCLLGLITAMNAHQIRAGEPSMFRLVWIKGKIAPRPLYEGWNSFSAVRVLGDIRHPFYPRGWGLNPKCIVGSVTGQLYEDIDGNASTCITNFTGDLSKVDYLKCDVTNIGEYLVNKAKVLVIGVGGGRDVLSALVFGQREVLGIELNEHIIDALTKYFGDFAGHLEKLPNVRLVNDEARSYVARSHEKFDFIQISLIDTWAATSAGAFALAENSLYTTDAWRIFIDHLSNSGILSVSRWYPNNNPIEIYRLLSLAASSLRASGIEDPRRHLALVRYETVGVDVPDEPGIGTLLVSRSPLTPEQLSILVRESSKLGFQVMLSPLSAQDPNLALIAEQKSSPAELASQFSAKLSAPTDDSPYFFQFSDPARLSTWIKLFQEKKLQHTQGLAILAILSCVLSFLLLLCVFLPLKLRSSSVSLKGASSLCIYFLSIGMGYIFIEISQMQRLAVFLGNPTYSLAVVLLSMLAFTGVGSMLTYWLDKRGILSSPALRLSVICIAVVMVGLGTPLLTEAYMAADASVRIMVAAATLAPLGLTAGMAFPTGMKMAATRAGDLTAWLWAINGGASVLSSVLAVLVSITCGISFCYYLACAFYMLGALAARSVNLQQPALAYEQA